ncbi:hypothetical protein [Candidatus Binatus sp.]|uniref:hypothetical protein n=1 Tax=Candidatus Binatus sp. TaxID=2811406 RepID=UPI003C3F6ABC
MANYKYTNEGTKSAVAEALSTATLADAVSMDGPHTPLHSDATAASHFASAMTAAATALASLVGTASRVRVVVTGSNDPNTSAPHPGAAASKIQISVIEVW